MERRSIRKTPGLFDILLLGFLAGSVLNTSVSILLFLQYSESYQYLYSAISWCWKKLHPLIIIPFTIYESVMIGFNWALVLFFTIIHLVHLLCTKEYLILLRYASFFQMLVWFKCLSLVHVCYFKCIFNSLTCIINHCGGYSEVILGRVFTNSSNWFANIDLCKY